MFDTLTDDLMDLLSSETEADGALAIVASSCCCSCIGCCCCC